MVVPAHAHCFPRGARTRVLIFRPRGVRRHIIKGKAFLGLERPARRWSTSLTTYCPYVIFSSSPFLLTLKYRQPSSKTSLVNARPTPPRTRRVSESSSERESSPLSPPGAPAPDSARATRPSHAGGSPRRHPTRGRASTGFARVPSLQCESTAR